MDRSMDSANKVNLPFSGAEKIKESATTFKRWARRNPFVRYGSLYFAYSVRCCGSCKTPTRKMLFKGSEAHMEVINNNVETQYIITELGPNSCTCNDMEKVKDDSAWEIIQTTKELSRTGPLEGSKPKKTSLEEELKALQQKIDINKYEYKRIPKPNEGVTTRT